MQYIKLGKLIKKVENNRNKDLKDLSLLGINIEKEFMPSVANVIGTDMSKYQIVKKMQFACNPMHLGRDERMPTSLLMTDDEILVSPAYFVFEVIDKNIILPEYLMLYFKRNETDRFLWFKTDSSVRGGLAWDQMCEIEIPVPSIDKQAKIIEQYNQITQAINLKNKLNNNLEQQAQAIYNFMFKAEQNIHWEKGVLSDLIEVKYGKDHKFLSDGCVPVFGSGGIMRYVNKALYTEESVLIPRKGSLHNIIYVNEPFWSVDTMFYTKMLRPNIAKYIHIFMLDKNLTAMDTGSAVPSMTTNILNSMEIIIPPSEKLEKFEKIMNPIYASIKNNFKLLEKLKGLREVMLPNLLSEESSDKLSFSYYVRIELFIIIFRYNVKGVNYEKTVCFFIFNLFF